MNKHTKAKPEFDALRDLVSEAFPDIACLRCGKSEFFLKGLAGQINTGRFLEGGANHDFEETIRLVCQTCGFVEEHSIRPLIEATKPIKRRGK